jgi:hypothetical protein
MACKYCTGTVQRLSARYHKPPWAALVTRQAATPNPVMNEGLIIKSQPRGWAKAASPRKSLTDRIMKPAVAPDNYKQGETSMTTASDLLQRHIQTLVADNAQWQTLIADDLVWELPYGPGIGDPARLALPWHFRGVLKDPPVAVRATIRNRRRSEQFGDDGTADLRQRWLRRWSVEDQLFSPDPPPSGAGVADRRRRCRSSARADAGQSRTALRSRPARVLA